MELAALDVDDFDDAERRLAPMRAVATPILDTVGVLPYAAIGTVHADPIDPIDAPVGSGPWIWLP